MAQQLQIDGKSYVLLPMADYEALCSRAGSTIAVTDDDLSPLPKRGRRGRFPAEEYARVSLARDVIRARREARLTQTELAALAGIRQETLSRIESGTHKAAVRTIDRIERALADLPMRKKVR
jgi:DNA-binding XRE family transcriptional regulator